MTHMAPALAYFGIVFGAGFLLGTFRVLVLLPVLGERTAELLELPLMVTVVILAARWLVRRSPWRLPPRSALLSGWLAFAMMLTADVGVGLWGRGLSLSDLFLARDPVSGTAYYAALLVFALMPWWWTRHPRTQTVPPDHDAPPPIR